MGRLAQDWRSHLQKQLKVLPTIASTALSDEELKALHNVPHLGFHHQVKEYTKEGVPTEPSASDNSNIDNATTNDATAAYKDNRNETENSESTFTSGSSSWRGPLPSLQTQASQATGSSASPSASNEDHASATSIRFPLADVNVQPQSSIAASSLGDSPSEPSEATTFNPTSISTDDRTSETPRTEPTPPAATPTAATPPAATPPATQPTGTDSGGNGEDHETEIDANLIQMEMRNAEEQGDDTHARARKFAKYVREKEDLIKAGTKVEVKFDTLPPGIEWYVVEDVKRSNLPPLANAYPKRGVKNFNFNDRTVPATDKRKRNSRVNFFKILEHLWPGSAQDQLKKMNDKIEYVNKMNQERSRRIRKINYVSEREFWVFWGLVLANRTTNNENGEAMFDKTKPFEGLNGRLPQFNPNVWMKKYRFKEIKRFISYSFENLDKKEAGTDPWWQIVDLFEEFNKNRRETLASSIIMVIDESMSAYRPQTTAKGNLPHLTFCARKPEDLGTEFKTVACTETGIMKYVQLCRKRTDDTRTKEYKAVSKKKICQVTLRAMNEAKIDRTDLNIEGEIKNDRDVFLKFPQFYFTNKSDKFPHLQDENE